MPPQISNRRRKLYTLVAWVIPIAFFALLEAGLTLAGYGRMEPLFEPVAANDAYLQPNPRVIRRFFANPEQAPAVSIDTTYFLRDKPDGLLRIVVQGGSSAAGFPYGRWASPAGMLERRLADSFPDRAVEVISTAMSAVNSYTLLDFADEIIAQRPDAIVIYAGHNEYLGVLGVGSSLAGGGSRAVKRLMLRLARLRTMQLVQRTLAGIRRDQPQERSGTLMARIAGERAIALGSPMYQAGLDQFRDNLGDLVARYRAAGIPVVLGTLASNQRDQPPFANLLSPATDPDAWTGLYEAAAAAVQSGDPRADEAVASLLALDDGAADAWYLEARRRHAAGDHAGAGAAFDQARDLDGLRFRAPGAFNAVLAELAKAPDVYLAPVREAMAADTADGLIGDELMLEHLHPNLRGYFLLADACAHTLAATGLVPAPPAWMTSDEAWRRQPLSQIEKLAGEYRIARLKGDWPFVAEKRVVELPPPKATPERIAQAWFTDQLSWIDAMNQALVHYQRSGDYAEAARVAKNIAAGFPFEANPKFVAGQMLIRDNRQAEALVFFHAAASQAPGQPEYLIALSQAFFANEQIDNARRTLERLLAVDPGHERARQMLEFLASRPGG